MKLWPRVWCLVFSDSQCSASSTLGVLNDYALYKSTVTHSLWSCSVLQPSTLAVVVVDAILSTELTLTCFYQSYISHLVSYHISIMLI